MKAYIFNKENNKVKCVFDKVSKVEGKKIQFEDGSFCEVGDNVDFIVSEFFYVVGDTVSNKVKDHKSKFEAVESPDVVALKKQIAVLQTTVDELLTSK